MPRWQKRCTLQTARMPVPPPYEEWVVGLIGETRARSCPIFEVFCSPASPSKDRRALNVADDPPRVSRVIMTRVTIGATAIF
jgi:hypothetical protein